MVVTGNGMAPMMAGVAATAWWTGGGQFHVSLYVGIVQKAAEVYRRQKCLLPTQKKMNQAST